MKELLEMSFKDYRAIPAINNSSLQEIRHSIDKYIHNIDNPKKGDFFTFGQAYHKYILERHEFEDEFFVMPEVDRRTKLGKLAWAEAQEQSEGKTVIAFKDYEKIKAMSRRLQKDSMISNILKQGVCEKTIVGSLGGIKCKGRYDLILEESKIVVDFKTTKDCSKESFITSLYKYGYARQASF